MRMFANPTEAAEELARDLAFLRDEKPLILAIPNQGVPIAEIVARSLDGLLDILLLERLSAPRYPDHVVGAVDEHGRISIVRGTARWHRVTTRELVEPARDVFRDIQRRRARFRALLPEVNVRDRTVIVVDAHVASGARMLGAISSVRDRGAARVIAAAPAGCGDVTWQLHETAHQVVIPHTIQQGRTIDQIFKVMPDVNDERVEEILRAWMSTRQEPRESVKTIVMRFVTPQQHVLYCEVDTPPARLRKQGPMPAVLFAHGVESDGRSQRTVPISRRLAQRGIVGVRPDFTGHGRSDGTQDDCDDEQMLSDLKTVYENLICLKEINENCIGVNGAGTGGMIALRFAAQTPSLRALVIRGPVCGDEAEAAHRVTAPTLLIHAEQDRMLKPAVTALNRELHATHELLTIPNSSRLFNDPISRELMMNASVDWLADHLQVAAPAQNSSDDAPTQDQAEN